MTANKTIYFFILNLFLISFRMRMEILVEYEHSPSSPIYKLIELTPTGEHQLKVDVFFDGTQIG